MSFFKMSPQSLISSELFSTQAAHKIPNFRDNRLSLDQLGLLVMRDKDFGEVDGSVLGEATGRQLP